MSRYLYIAPRYHTNQVPIIRGLIKEGHEVKFIAQYEGSVEDHSDLTPVVLGYSKCFEFIYSVLTKTGLGKGNKAFLLRLKAGWPAKSKLRGEILEFNPDVVITRERSAYSMTATSICKRAGIPIILYDQSPLWLDEIKNDFAHKFVRKHTPDRRMTPVMGVEMPGKVKESKSAFVPFVMEPKQSPDEKKTEDTIRILEVGKYESRKNHLMMVDVFERLSEQYNIKLTIIGECTSDDHKAYFSKLKEKVDDLVNRYPELSEKIELLVNLSPKDMDEQYRKADIFVIPSTAEPASVSQIEAMAYSLPAICSDRNGTACYIESGINGYHFKDGDESSLYECLQLILKDDDIRIRMGEESFRLINEKYQISNYIQGIDELLKL